MAAPLHPRNRLAVWGRGCGANLGRPRRGRGRSVPRGLAQNRSALTRPQHRCRARRRTTSGWATRRMPARDLEAVGTLLGPQWAIRGRVAVPPMLRSSRRTSSGTDSRLPVSIRPSHRREAWSGTMDGRWPHRATGLSDRQPSRWARCRMERRDQPAARLVRLPPSRGCGSRRHTVGRRRAGLVGPGRVRRGDPPRTPTRRIGRQSGTRSRHPRARMRWWIRRSARPPGAVELPRCRPSRIGVMELPTRRQPPPSRRSSRPVYRRPSRIVWAVRWVHPRRGRRRPARHRTSPYPVTGRWRRPFEASNTNSGGLVVGWVAGGWDDGSADVAPTVPVLGLQWSKGSNPAVGRSQLPAADRPRRPGRIDRHQRAKLMAVPRWRVAGLASRLVKVGRVGSCEAGRRRRVGQALTPLRVRVGRRTRPRSATRIRVAALRWMDLVVTRPRDRATGRTWFPLVARTRVVLRRWTVGLACRTARGGRRRRCEAGRRQPMRRVGRPHPRRARGSVGVQSPGESVGLRGAAWEAAAIPRSSSGNGRIRMAASTESVRRATWRGMRELRRRLRPGRALNVAQRKPTRRRRSRRRRRNWRSRSRRTARGATRIQRCLGRVRPGGRGDRLGPPGGRVVVGRRGRAGRWLSGLTGRMAGRPRGLVSRRDDERCGRSMLRAKGSRRVQAPAVVEEARGGVPATTMTPMGHLSEGWIRPAELGPRAGW